MAYCKDIFNEIVKEGCGENRTGCACEKPIPSAVKGDFVQDPHYNHTDNNFTDEYKEDVEDIDGMKVEISKKSEVEGTVDDKGNWDTITINGEHHILPKGGSIIRPVSPVDQTMLVEEGAGVAVIANPAASPTAVLKTIQIGGVVYAVDGSVYVADPSEEHL